MSLTIVTREQQNQNLEHININDEDDDFEKQEQLSKQQIPAHLSQVTEANPSVNILDMRQQNESQLTSKKAPSDQEQEVHEETDNSQAVQRQIDNLEHEDEEREAVEDEDEEEDNEDNMTQPLLFVDINLGGDEQERIVVYEGDTAEQLAHQFC